LAAPITAEVVNAFVDPVIDVIKTCIGLDTELSGMDLTNQIDPAPFLSATIDFRGTIVGPVTWVVSEELARVIASKMLAIDPADALNIATCREAVAELANIISGNATGKLCDAGYAVEILPPTPIDDKSDRMLTERALSVTLCTSAGKIKLLLGIRFSPQ
jgi:CheY-specific phosphatase CheX